MSKFCMNCGHELDEKAIVCTGCGVSQPSKNTKNKLVAGLLGLFLGGIGIHKFYLGKIGWGIVYILFCWTYIPAIVGLIEGIVYLCMDEQKFMSKYCVK